MKNNNYSLKFNFFDALVGVVALLLIITSLVATNLVYAKKNSYMDKTVEIHYKDKTIKTINMSKMQDEQIEITIYKIDYDKLLGDVVIYINKDKGICIHEITCPNHRCKKQGWVKRVGVPIMCPPNNLFVIINLKNADIDVTLG